MTMSTIHITNGDVAADSLRKALDQARRADVVLALRDDLAAGPLHGIDDTPQVRADFWQGVIGDSTRDFLAGLEQQADELKAVVDGTTHVVVWHGQSAADQLTLRRVCFHLREMPERLNDGLLVSDSLVLWRLRELAAAGQLQLRGDADDWRSLEMNVTRATLSPA
jgi:hypothetical protein